MYIGGWKRQMLLEKECQARSTYLHTLESRVIAAAIQVLGLGLGLVDLVSPKRHFK